MCVGRGPRRFNGICGTGYDSPMLPPSYSGRTGGTGCDIPRYPPQYSGSHIYRAKPFVRRYRGGNNTALWTQQQPGPHPFCSFGWEQRYACRNGPPVDGGLANSIAQGLHRSGDDTALWPQQQPGLRPFCSFGWKQRYACHDRLPVNAGLAHNIAQGQAQRDVGVYDREEQQRPSTEVDCHGGSLSEVFGPPNSKDQQQTSTEVDCHGEPVSEVSGPQEAIVSLARGGLPLPPRGTLSPPTAVISDSAFEEWLHSDEMEMPMCSLLEGQRQQPPTRTAISTAEGPQQSAPTAVALAAAASAAAAVTGTRVFLAVSSKSVAEAPASSAGAASAAVSAAAPAVPAAAPATDGTVFSTASVGGAARAPASAGGAALTAAPATGGTVPSAASVGGVPASSAVAAASAKISAAESATSGIVPSAPSIRWTVGGRESSTEAVSLDAEAEAAPLTGGTAAPVELAARAARALASAAGSTGDSWIAITCGERGASTQPFDPGTVLPLEVRYSSDGHGSSSNSSSGGSSSSSNNDNTSDHDSWWDATCVGALLLPFDQGKRCRRRMRRGKAILGVDLPFDRGNEWGQMQHGGLRASC